MTKKAKKEEKKESIPAEQKREAAEEKKPAQEKKQEAKPIRILKLNLRKAYETSRKARAGKAIKIIRKEVAKHTKTDIENVKVTAAVNKKVWTRGAEKPPKKIELSLQKSGEDVLVA